LRFLAWPSRCDVIRSELFFHHLRIGLALLHKSAIGQGIPNPK
jgi:hypothetical protein